MPETNLPQLLAITGQVLFMQTVNEQRLAVAAGSPSRRVAFSAVGDNCPLCQALDGKVFEADSAEARRYTPPLHINCNCIWVEVGDDELGAVDRLTPRQQELVEHLVEQHGHFVSNPEKYVALKIPAGPAGRDFTFRRGKAGERGTVEWNRPRYGLDDEFEQTGVAEISERWGVVGDLRKGVHEPSDTARRISQALRDMTPLEREAARLQYQQNSLADLYGKLAAELESLTSENATRRQRLRADRLRQRIDRIYAKSGDLADRERQLHAQMRQMVLGDLPPRRTVLRVELAADVPSELRERIGTVVDELSRWLPPSEIEEHVITVSLTTEDRSTHRDGMIFLRPTASMKSVLHEIGHVVELRDPVARSAAKEFLARRTDGEPSRRWSEFDETARDDEWVKPDAFANAYVGKQYAGGETEVLSMGLEMLYADPVAFARRDPDHCALIIRYLRGELGAN